MQTADIPAASVLRLQAELWGSWHCPGLTPALSPLPASLPEALLTSCPPASPGHSAHPATHRPQLPRWPHISLSPGVPTPGSGSTRGNGAPNPSRAESSHQTSPSSDAEPCLL